MPAEKGRTSAARVGLYQLHLPTEQQLQQELKRKLRQMLPAYAAKAVPAKKKPREGKR